MENATVAVSQALSAFDFQRGDVLVTTKPELDEEATAPGLEGVERPGLAGLLRRSDAVGGRIRPRAPDSVR